MRARLAPLLPLGWAVLGAPVAGCSGDRSADFDTGDSGFTGGSTTLDTASPTSSTDTAVPPDPVWWSLDGSLQVAYGAVDLTTSTFTVRLWSAAAAEICATERTVASAPPVDLGEEAVHASWSVTLSDGTGCVPPVPSTFDLGIGAYDAQLDPALAPTGLDSEALLGLYVRADAAAPLYVFGIAGTAEQLAGTPIESPPLPDGVYLLDGLHLLPL